MNVDFLVPVKTVSEANDRCHWRVRYNRKVDQQVAVAVAWKNNLKSKSVSLPCVVKLTRVGPRRLDDDNLRGAFKFIRDQVATMLKVDDGSDHVEWQYSQIANGHREYAVKISIEPKN